MPSPLPTANVRFPEWWGDALNVEYRTEYLGEWPQRYDPASLRITIGSREDLYQHIVTAVWDTLNERTPYGVPMPDRDVVREAASMIVQSMEPDPPPSPPAPTCWERLRRLG